MLIDETQEYWISVEITHPSGEYPFACDTGPNVLGKGAWYSMNGGITWYDMLVDGGNDINWKIRTKIQDGDFDLIYFDEKFVTNLNPIEEEYLEFTPSWSALVGDYLVDVSTKLIGDDT